jgi:hypothetical protein
MKVKQQTEDPGQNHSNGNSGVMGYQDFTGQDGYEEVEVEKAADAPELAQVGINVLDGSSGASGRGVSSKVLDPARVKGYNP